MSFANAWHAVSSTYITECSVFSFNVISFFKYIIHYNCLLLELALIRDLANIVCLFVDGVYYNCERSTIEPNKSVM